MNPAGSAQTTHPEEGPINRRIARLLVMLPSWVGDVVMATPVLRALREILPQTRITGVMRPGLDTLLTGSPWLDETIVHRNRGLRGPWQLARAIRRSQPQVGLLLPNSFRSALALRLSGCPIRIGYGRDGRSMLLTHAPAPPDRSAPSPTIDYYAQLAATALGVAEIDRTMHLACTAEEQAAADELLRGIEGRFIILNPGASKRPKRWPAQHFAAVGDALAAAHDVRVVVNGSPAEAAVVAEVIAASRSAEAFVNLVERGVGLGSLKAVIDRSSLMITNDTGPRHIAAAMGTPIVSLFGPTDHRWTLLPGVTERRLLAEPFLPEQLAADDHAEACDIARIRPGDVIAAASELLESAPIS